MNLLQTMKELKKRRRPSSVVLQLFINSNVTRVSIRKTFAQFLRNETQNCPFFALKKQKFAQSFAKVISRKIALFRFCEN